MASSTPHPSTCTCAECGATLTGPLLDVAFGWPDDVFALPAEDRSARTWQAPIEHPDFIVLDGSRRFVRGLLPLPLEAGLEFRYGVWLEVATDEFNRILQVWHDETRYMSLRFAARLANALPPWGERTLGQSVEAAAREPTERPYVVCAEEDWLMSALEHGWDHTTYETVISRYAGNE